MGNAKSKKVPKNPSGLFEREKLKAQLREEKRQKKLNPANKRHAAKSGPIPVNAAFSPPVSGPGPLPVPSHVRSYDDEALARMREQLNNDSDAFLLNNILLSVQFFENYEREVQDLKSYPVSERQHTMDEAMVQHHKHVFFADRIQEYVQEHVLYQRRRDELEPIATPRTFVIYDNVEASEPGDTSDYCAVLDAPFYKLRIEDCKEPGYVKLKKIEVLESALSKETNGINISDTNDSTYTDSEKESNASDDLPYVTKDKELLQKVKKRLSNMRKEQKNKDDSQTAIDKVNNEAYISKIAVEINQSPNNEKSNMVEINENDDTVVKPRKSILKSPRRFSQPRIEFEKVSLLNDTRHVSLDNIAAEDTETSGYRSNTSSRQTESSETESDYGYSTITEATTPKKIELSLQTNFSMTSGVLPEDGWITVNTRSLDWSDDEDDDNASKISTSRNLYETHQYLSSSVFMKNFIDNFILSLGSGMGLSEEMIENALTQGASIYYNYVKDGIKMSNEVFPALLAAWPNAANQWVIRERRIIKNPRTNFSYQWPTKYMVSKAYGFGCVLVPIGFRPKRGVNPEQKMQWRIIFPAAERYLESCLAHSHMRCYLFTLLLHKTFMENETSKMGIDAGHIKNHLFWQCEENYARWPEDRLGESLRLFLRNFYFHFGQSRFPNYFIESCNEFKYIPNPLLLKLQKRLKDILEKPVLHILYAINKLNYLKDDFYPSFNSQRLYEILTCRNPLKILNPNLPVISSLPSNYRDSLYERYDIFNDEEDVTDKAKIYDKEYQWKLERLRQIKERKRTNTSNKKQRNGGKEEPEINRHVILPVKMEAERRRLVLEFFIPHFIAMARSSEKFEALRQAIIYLEQAHRLCILLKEEPAGDLTANDYLHVIREKLADCQRKLVQESRYKIAKRDKRYSERVLPTQNIRKHRPRYEHINNQDSPTDSVTTTPFTFVDVHIDRESTQNLKTLSDWKNSGDSNL